MWTWLNCEFRDVGKSLANSVRKPEKDSLEKRGGKTSFVEWSTTTTEERGNRISPSNWPSSKRGERSRDFIKRGESCWNVLMTGGREEGEGSTWTLIQKRKKMLGINSRVTSTPAFPKTFSSFSPVKSGNLRWNFTGGRTAAAAVCYKHRFSVVSCFLVRRRNFVMSCQQQRKEEVTTVPLSDQMH